MSYWGNIFNSKLELCAQNKSFNKLFEYVFEIKDVKKLGFIGPHNEDVISLIYGTLLGDAYGERRGSKTRICFQQEESNIEYLYW